MSIDRVKREPEGTPAGGRFATGQKSEPVGVVLTPASAGEESVWVASSAARRLIGHGLAANYDDAMSLLREHGVWVRGNVVDAESVRRIIATRQRPEDAEPRNLHRELATMTSGRLALTVAGKPFTVFYDERPSRGDAGGLVPGSVTGDFEVCDDSPGGPGVVFRQHVSPTGQGSDTKGYAAERVMATIVRLDQASADRQRPPRPDLACAVDAHGVDPTPENRVALMAAMLPL